jgi:plastocyanin
MKQRLLIVTSALTALLAACSEHTGPDARASNVSVEDNRFIPQQFSVATGGAVTWVWRGSNLHDVTFDDGPASVAQENGQYQREFSAAGTYRYHCTVHGLSMSGSVVVTPNP